MNANEDQIPWITWLSGGAALLVLVATGFVLVSPAEGSHGQDATVAAPSADGSLAKVSPTEPTPGAGGGGKHPLDISAALTDARTRAGLRLDNPALIGVRLIIDSGKPFGATEVTYAAASGRPLPGGPVTAKRLRISYDGGNASEEKETDRQTARVLPDPNCPLEAAFRTVTQSGASGAARFYAVYTHSVRHQRPIWILTAKDGVPYHVDADNCARLRR